VLSLLFVGGFPLLFNTPWPLLANTLVTGLLPLFPAFIELERGCSDDENMPLLLLFIGMTLVVTLS